MSGVVTVVLRPGNVRTPTADDKTQRLLLFVRSKESIECGRIERTSLIRPGRWNPALHVLEGKSRAGRDVALAKQDDAVAEWGKIVW